MPRRWPPRPPRLGRALLLRIGAWAVLVLGLVFTVMIATLFVGMRRNDAAIEANLGTATATVLSVGLLRTGVEFVTADGLTMRPPTGVLYPGLLHPGQKFMVEYSTVNPDLVRVAGRTAAVGNLVLGVTLLVVWLIAGPLVYLLRRWSGAPLRRGRAANMVAAITAAVPTVPAVAAVSAVAAGPSPLAAEGVGGVGGRTGQEVGGLTGQTDGGAGEGAGNSIGEPDENVREAGKGAREAVAGVEQIGVPARSEGGAD